MGWCRVRAGAPSPPHPSPLSLTAHALRVLRRRLFRPRPPRPRLVTRLVVVRGLHEDEGLNREHDLQHRRRARDPPLAPAPGPGAQQGEAHFAAGVQVGVEADAARGQEL